MAEHDARKLLDFIVHSRLATLEEKQAEFAARAIDPDDQPEVMSSHEVQTEAEAAQRMFPAFWAGLKAAQQAGNAPLVLDDADPQQNEMASALIRFLVKAHLATVESEEVGPDHYRYQITLDRPGLQRTATLADVDLNAALAP
jgi:hypothetical protein